MERQKGNRLSAESPGSHPLSRGEERKRRRRKKETKKDQPEKEQV